MPKTLDWRPRMDGDEKKGKEITSGNEDRKRYCRAVLCCTRVITRKMHSRVHQCQENRRGSRSSLRRCTPFCSVWAIFVFWPKRYIYIYLGQAGALAVPHALDGPLDHRQQGEADDVVPGVRHNVCPNSVFRTGLVSRFPAKVWTVRIGSEWIQLNCWLVH